MKTLINIILVLIIAMCTWRGYKKGFVSGIIGILAIVIALYGGSLLSEKYSGEVVPVLEPFVDGFVDSQNTRDEAMKAMGYENSELSLEDVMAQDSSLRYDYAYVCIKSMGVSDENSEKLAEKAVDLAQSSGVNMTRAVVNLMCSTISYVGGLVLAFLLILILIVAVTSIGNLSFKFPKMPMLDYVGGALLGLAKSLIYCVLICWLLSFMGLLLGDGTLESMGLVNFFLKFDFLTGRLL